MPESLNLFLVEDDDDVALLIRKNLERVHHQVVRCRTGADALIVLHQRCFDLILLDQFLPDLSGLDLLQRLEQDGSAPPILMLTARGDEPLAARALRAGVLDYLVKDEDLGFLVELPKRVQESVTRHRLEQMNRLLVQSLESASDGILLVDRQCLIRNVNQALLSLTGYDRGELLGQCPRLILGDLPGGNVSPFEPIGPGWQGEHTVRRKDGSRVQTSLSISRIEDRQGNPTHYVGILRDVTETKKLERQLLQAQKMQSIGTLAGGIAHEFNNLLAGINGYAALALREDQVEPAVRQFLENVVALSERGALLTRQLLAFARKPALSWRRTPVLDVVQATVDLVRRTLHRHVVLDVAALEPAGPMLVEADANQLQQALVNLVLNARDAIRERERTFATSPGESDRSTVTVRVGPARFSLERIGFPQNVPPGDYVRMQVVDAGCGMTPEVLLQAVDPFFTTKEVGQGTGLGLSVVFGIIQAHQGFLQIESIPGQGSTVSVYLPRAAEMIEPSQSLAERPESEPRRAPTPLGILVVDDEEAVLDIMRRYLEIAGHHVQTAGSGRAALDLLALGRTFDLVILDRMIPTEDAGLTLEEFRRRAPGVPVILCTGLPEAEPQLLQNSTVTLVRKPFRMTDLLEGVQHAMEPQG